MQSAAPAAETMILERVTMERYEGEDGHPYVHDVRTNNTKKNNRQSSMWNAGFLIKKVIP